MNTQNKVGIDNLVNAGVDVIESAKAVGVALGDGFQIADAGALFTVVPRVKNVINIGRAAVSELMDLDASESAEVAKQIAERTGSPTTGILAKVNDGLALLARTHQEVVDDIELFQDWKQYVSNLT
jgi:hypothetical protein